MKQNTLPNNGAFETTDHPPTVTFRTGTQTLALPYDDIEWLELDDRRGIHVEFDEFTVDISGSNLGRLWKDLRAYRVLEVATNACTAAKALGGESATCCVEAIVVRSKEPDDDIPLEESDARAA